MHSKYRIDIDGLRAIAVLMVLVFHFNLMNIGEAGFIGVDVFFVISGYLISNLVWSELGSGRFTLKNFYLRRIRRLLPALVVVQLAVLACSALFLLPGEVIGVAKESIAAQAVVSNIYYWRTLNYFGLHAHSAFLLHTWSLGVEEQFYIFYPLLLMAVHRWAREWLLPVLLTLLVVSFGLNIAFVHVKPEATFYLLPTRAWELLAGALLVFVQPRFEQSATARISAALAGLGLLVAAYVVHRPGTPFPGFFALLPVCGSALLLLAGSGEGNLVSRWLSQPVAVFIGRISYPLYLVHWPINVFALTLLPDYTTAWRWGLFFASIILATAITFLVEAPVRTRKVLSSERKLFGAYAMAFAAIVAIAGSAWSTHGWRWRYNADVLKVADIAGDGDRQGSAWDFGRGDILTDRLRRVGRENAAPTWLIYGDSHASALAGAVSVWLNERGEAGELAYHSNCLPLLDTGNEVCRDFNRQALARAAGRHVLLISIWRQPLEGAYLGRDQSVLQGVAATDDASAALVRTVAALRGAGAEVFVWEPLPPAQYAVPEATARSMVFGPHWPTATSLPSFRSEMAFVYKALDRAGVARTARIDPTPAICPGGTCTFERNGLPIYSDNNHPSQGSARWFARIFRTALP